MQPRRSCISTSTRSIAAVEQRDKPSLRGKPVIVGGVGPRGVVATASYEARRFGVRSAMSTAEARARCPHGAFLGGRFDAYQASSRAVMAVLRDLSPLVEPLSLDEAYVDLAAAPTPLDLSHDGLVDTARTVKQAVYKATGGLTASVGIGTSKLIAKIASELEKPDGAVVIPAGSERDLLRSMQVTVIPGIGPATAARLRQVGVTTIEELERLSESELVRVVGQAHGVSLYALARGGRRAPGRPGTGDEVGLGRGHLRARPGRPGAAGGHRRPACPDGLGTAREGAAERADDHPQGAPPRLLDADPVVDAGRPDRPRRGAEPGGQRPAGRARHVRRASGCSGWVSPR